MTKRKKASTPPPEKNKKRPPRRPPVPAEISSARKYAAWEMRVLNPRMTYAEITKKLNEIFPDYPLKSEHQAVEKMIKQAEEEYIESHKAEVDRIKAEAGASLDFVRREAADAWQKSQDWLKVITKRENQTIEQILKAQTGDSAYLKVIKDAAIEKAKLFGAVAPIKHNVKHGGKVEITPQLSPEEIAQRVNMLLNIAEDRKKNAD
jgi:hypothetical protein